ncbi:GNAT family N-acetyltransferase [Eubacteriales bacterium OttesenSCG-928-A19]|nr:GNAT family N-acetyltransferase [Eubacteriales bacterium OttesenSCG-928-A19]
MPADIEVRAVSPDILAEVLALEVLPEQRRHIETVQECLDEAKDDARWRPVALFAGSALVGFAMYGQFPSWLDASRDTQVWLDRLLIDRRYQGKGYGEQSLRTLLSRLRTEYGDGHVYLSVYGDNDRAIALYKRYGFAFTGALDTKGERVMRREASPPLGMPTLLEVPDALACAKVCAELGLSFVELNMNLPAYQPGGIDESHMELARARHGVSFTLHLDERFDPCDLNPYVREAYLRTATDAIALAKRHAMPVVNMHFSPGVYFSLPDRQVYLYEAYGDPFLESLRRFRGLCEEAVGDSEICISVENCDGFPAFVREGIAFLLESPVFGLTLDIGHNYCANGADETFYAEHADRVHHLHIHDAAGGKCHLPLGEGTLDIRAALEMARARRARAVIEVKNLSGLRRSMEGLHDSL